MPRHVVQEGEDIGFICWLWGVHYETLWRRSENAELVRTLMEREADGDQRQGGMAAQLRRGDVIFIPEEFGRDLPVAPGDSNVQMNPYRDHFLDVAHERAFGRPRAAMRWEPTDGYEVNRRILTQVYDYYRDTFNRDHRFLWAGLGRLAGAAVVRGLDMQTRGTGELAGFTEKLFCIAKAIFYDVAWLHEAVIYDERLAWVLATGYDARPHRTRYDGTIIPDRYLRARDAGVQLRPEQRVGFGSYGRAVRQITRGDTDERELGNLALLANEQWVNIQPWYDDMRNAGQGPLLSHAGAFTRSVHPYHSDFIVSVQGDISLAPARWRWIADVPNAMWPQWVALPESEQQRLVNLSFDHLMARRWEPLVAAHVPPGTQY